MGNKVLMEGIMAEIRPARIDLENRTRLETVIPLSTPYLVFLDPSDICNAKCIHCPTGSGEALKYKKPQLMDFDLYKKIIDDLCEMPEKVKTLRLYADGEPLLNPTFPHMVSYAKATGRFGQIDTTTNALLLDFEMQNMILDAGLDKIFISVPHDYGAHYHSRIASLYRLSRGRCQVHVKIIGDNMDEDDKKGFYDDFGPISDRMFIENLSPCWPEFNVGQVGTRGIYGQPLTPAPKVCPYITYSVKINSDGSVSACFLDYRHQMIIGDLKTEKFKAVWNGKKLREYQIMHLSGIRWSHPFCANCGQLTYGAPDILDPFAEDILKKLLDNSNTV
jgi:radical SAM protein with 4Fe4S-binding SPASM domain